MFCVRFEKAIGLAWFSGITAARGIDSRPVACCKYAELVSAQATEASHARRDGRVTAQGEQDRGEGGVLVPFRKPSVAY